MENSLFNDLKNNSETVTKKHRQKKVNKVVIDDSIKLAGASMFDGEFKVEAKELIQKISMPVKVEENDPEKLLKSKKISIEDRLAIIKTNVLKVLGKQKDNIIVIRDLKTFEDYITMAIDSGRIAIDTETNNSTDPVNCNLMGLCLYYSGGKQAYIPVNHIDNKTKEKLSCQLTEANCRAQLQRIIDSKIQIIMHNGKFDYEVLKCTCKIEVVPTWDTLVAARLMDENTFKDKNVSLKVIYTNYIDPSQEKYSIDQLFENIAYAYVEPDIFALYAATDSMMTDRLYIWQCKTFYDLPENAKVKKLLETIEIPIIQVTAEIELYGVLIDQELGARLKAKYNTQLLELDTILDNILTELKPIINQWRLTTIANERTKQYVPIKTKMAAEKIELQYPNIDSNGKRYKVGKSKADQLPEVINMSSSTQLAILLFDILGCSYKDSRAVGENEIKTLLESLKYTKSNNKNLEYAYDICNNILTRRGLVKLITTYIDVIPDLAKHWADGRIRYRLNSTGTDTGRFASGGKFKFLDENENPVVLNSINSQNIPSHNPEVRLLFKAETSAKLIEADDNEPFIIDEASDVEMATGWVRCKNIKIGDLMVVNGIKTAVKSINYDAASRKYIFEV